MAEAEAIGVTLEQLNLFLEASNDARSKEAEFRSLVDSILENCNQSGLDPNYLFLELEFRAIKKILETCTEQQRQSFAVRLSEWVFGDE